MESFCDGIYVPPRMGNLVSGLPDWLMVRVLKGFVVRA